MTKTTIEVLRQEGCTGALPIDCKVSEFIEALNNVCEGIPEEFRASATICIGSTCDDFEHESTIEINYERELTQQEIDAIAAEQNRAQQAKDVTEAREKELLEYLLRKYPQFR